jgi:excisionase family DNA binding protein
MIEIKNSGVKIADMELFTVEQLAERFEVSERTILKRINDGSLTARKMGKRWFISSDAIRAYFLTAADERDEQE